MELISTDTTFSSPYFEIWKEMPQEPKGHVVMEIFSVKHDYGTRYLPSTVASKNSSTAAWWYRYLDFRCGSLLMLLVAEVVAWLQAHCVDCLRTRSAQDTIRVFTKCSGWLKAHNGNRGSTLHFPCWGTSILHQSFGQGAQSISPLAGSQGSSHVTIRSTIK